MDFNLPKEIDAYRKQIRNFVDEHILPLENNPSNFDEHESIVLPLLTELRERARSEGIWALQVSKERGGGGLPVVGMAACYEEMGRSLYAPAVFNSHAPDDGNMMLLEKVATNLQKDRWLQPLIDGESWSAFAMTEPAPGSGSDPGGMMQTRAEKIGNQWKIYGRKWFISGAGIAEHFILVARTSDDPRKGLTAFLFHRDQPGWQLERRIPTMGPEEHGGHCELIFDGLTIDDENRLMGVGDGLKVTQIRLGTARLTHCMRWLGGACRAHDIALAYARERRAFGEVLGHHEGVGFMLADNGIELQQCRLMIWGTGWALDGGSKGRHESSMTKVAVSEALFRVAARCVQILGGLGMTEDTIVNQMFREIRGFRIYDGPSEVHRWAIAKRILKNH